MYRRRTLAALAATFTAALGFAAPALADSSIYFVQGLGDDAGATCAPEPYPSIYTCTSLRAAVAASEATPSSTSNVIVLNAAGTYQLQSTMALSKAVAIYGRGPRTTTVAAAPGNRAFLISDGIQVTFNRFGVSGGSQPGGNGGNILDLGVLFLINMRVTGGTAATGGGVGLGGTGELSTLYTSIDGNQATTAGGGIYAGSGTDIQVYESTVAFNRVTGSGSGGGIALGTASDSADLIGATVARNTVVTGTGGGISSPGGVVTVGESLVAANTAGGVISSCSGTGYSESQSGSNLADAFGCSFDRGSADPGMSTTLVNLGGDTDVVSYATAAKGIVANCPYPNDQRGAARNAGAACDAGAIERDATAPPISSAPLYQDPGAQPTPTPTPVATPVATPAPTAAPTPAPPVAGKSVGVLPVKGTVLVKLRGGKFVPLPAGATIPLGSEVDTRKGTVALTAVPKKGAAPQIAQFHDGIFKVTQSGTITNLQLTEPLAPCGKKGKAAAAAKKPKKRQLWGDGSGSFRTEGEYSAATVRGTNWLVEDSCAGTLTRVAQGVVAVRDNVRHKTVVLRKGGHYLAKPRR